MNKTKKLKPLDNIADVPPVTDAAEVGNGSTDIVFTDPVAYLPIEDEVDLERESIIAAQTQDQRIKGYKMFLDGRTLEYISRVLDVDNETISFWARDGKWADRLRKRNDIDAGVAREGVRRVRIHHAESEARESLELGKKIRKSVKNRLDLDDELQLGMEDMTLEEKLDTVKRQLRPLDLKNLADAAKASGDLGAHGMGTSDADSGDKEKINRQLVVIYGGDGLPPIRKVPPEDIVDVGDND